APTARPGASCCPDRRAAGRISPAHERRVCSSVVMLLATAPAPPPAPRPFPVRALDSTTGACLLVGAIWALIGAIAATALLSTAGAPWNDMILDRRGVVASGRALSATPRTTRVNGRRVFQLTYSFTDAGGVAHAASTVTTNRHLVGEARTNAPLAI